MSILRCISPRFNATTTTTLLRSLETSRRLTSQSGSTANDANQTLKRFWKDVGIEKLGGSYTVTLDNRPLKTPSGNKLLLPKDKALVTSLIATEWDSQEKMIKPHALPMTSLAARAIDIFNEQNLRNEIQHLLLKYLDTDTIRFYQTHPEQLVALQAKHWDPLHDWIRKTYDVEIHRTNSLLFTSQPEETVRKLKEVLDSLDHWHLAAMERTTLTTKSFVIGLALIKRQINAEEASLAAHVEVNSQTERWGEVEDTHDVDYHDIRRQLGSAACLISAF
ncbi:hypothetical protein M378DRAFT_71536 [Amanita muscaria Koide BX008]|uniref:ATP12-domain-containing protein n=1 Tax=Amanita muscaria (strain Koide BX008) TaxID=946122 RepID=A0A0C2X370_AMAMK|nr:hypothetical protein M378DRAFT_71536 [Amanita muscaria Koide BX008]